MTAVAVLARQPRHEFRIGDVVRHHEGMFNWLVVDFSYEHVTIARAGMGRTEPIILCDHIRLVKKAPR